MAALCISDCYNADPKWGLVSTNSLTKELYKNENLEISTTWLQIFVVQRNTHKKGKYKMSTSADIHDRMEAFTKGLCTEPSCLKITSSAYLKSQRTINWWLVV